MFDIGFSELLLIAVVALLVLGPEKLPTAARTLGLWVGKFRRTVSGIQSEISEELRLDELRRNAAIGKEQLDQELSEMKAPYQPASSTAGEETFVTDASKSSANSVTEAGSVTRPQNKTES